MNEIVVPISRLRRELNSLLRKQCVIKISRKGVIIAVIVPASDPIFELISKTPL